VRPVAIQDEFRSLLQMRYRLAPSLISAGQTVQKAGFPLAARCDLLWPEHRADGAGSNTQYMHLNSTLVAPLGDEQGTRDDDGWDGDREVWIPPGEWQSIWDGTNVTGPKTVKLSAPKGAHILAWHRRGSVIATVEEPDTLRMDQQDWSSLTAHAFPSSRASVSHRDIFESEREVRSRLTEGESEVNGQQLATRTRLTLETDGRGGVRLEIRRWNNSSSSSTGVDTNGDTNAPADSLERSWVVRVHLRQGERVSTITATGFEGADDLTMDAVTHIEPSSTCGATTPFGGAGAAPACNAGPTAEVHVPASAGRASIKMEVSRH
jgi:hypothetical protein